MLDGLKPFVALSRESCYEAYFRCDHCEEDAPRTERQRTESGRGICDLCQSRHYTYSNIQACYISDDSTVTFQDSDEVVSESWAENYGYQSDSGDWYQHEDNIPRSGLHPYEADVLRWCEYNRSPAGTLFDYETFDCAQAVNPDGIGIMSERGVEKFLGSDAAEDAWRHLRDLEDERLPYGIHFRLATHGDISLENCHPFRAPRSDALVMHNGIIRSTAHLATRSRSDTALFVEKFMGSAPGPQRSHHSAYFQRMSRLIGTCNTLLVFHANTAEFTICNEDVGLWMGDHWYSNSDCLPWNGSLEGRG